MVNSPQVELIWKDPRGELQRKRILWRHGCSNETLEHYIGDYFDAVVNGYRPHDYDYVPVPHAARVYVGSRVLAEWYLRPEVAPESLVTGAANQAGEASPQQYPSPATTTSPMDAASRPTRANNDPRSAAKATPVASGSGIPDA